MPNLEDGVFYGAAIVLLDLVGWRLMGLGASGLRLFVRALLFVTLTYIFFRSDINPLAPAPPNPDKFRHLLTLGIELFWWFQAAQLSTILLDRLILPKSWHRERLFQDVLGALVHLAAAVAAIAYVLDWPLRGVLVTSGALAIIVGLAIQSTLNDVFSGVVLNATQPFRLGDSVTIDDVEGQVVESNWRATSLINAQGNIVVVPNSVAAKAKIVNNSEPARMHGITVTLEVTPEVRPARVVEALERAAASARDVLENPKPVVNVRRAGTDSIEYEITCYVDALSKKSATKNTLFDLSYRHLASLEIDLRSLSVARDGRERLSHRQRLLRGIDMFRTLDDAEFAKIESALTRHEFDAGETIYTSFRDDDPTGVGKNALHILDSGIASVTLPQGGRQAEVRRMAPGDAIGQSGIVSGMQLHATVRAVTHVVIYCLDKSDLTPIIKARPEVGHQMCRALSDYRAFEEIFMTPEALESVKSDGILAWLRAGMQRLHDLVN